MPEEVGAWIVLGIFALGVVGWYAYVQLPPSAQQGPDSPVLTWRRRPRRLSWSAHRSVRRANRRGEAAPVELADLAACRAEAALVASEHSSDARNAVLGPTVRGGLGLSLAVAGAVSFTWDRNGWGLVSSIAIGILAIGDLTERVRATRLRARLARSYALNYALARQSGRRQPGPAGR